MTPSQAMTTIASDWADVGAAVDYIRALRGVERVSLVAWSLGGPRSGGYAAKNPQKVHRLVLLAPGADLPETERGKLPSASDAFCHVYLEIISTPRSCGECPNHVAALLSGWS